MKVSCVMPVGKGDTYHPVALTCFLSQDYERELELIVVDNSGEPISVPDDPRIKYFRVDRMPVGALRNYGNEQATGDILVNWDEDDWSASNRISFQVARLLESDRSVTGFHSIYYYDTSDGKTYKYWYETQGRNHPPYACGSSQLYTKAWWTKHKFPDTGVEDYQFQLEALHSGQLDSCDGAQLLVARAHSDSVCYPSQLGIHKQFPFVPKDELPAAFYEAIEPKTLTTNPVRTGKKKLARS